jgi:hypothetical protein
VDESATGPEAVGRAFVEALAAKDRAAIDAMFDPNIDFRGLTPGSEWRATDPNGVLEVVFGAWFEPTDHIREILDVRTRRIADRSHLLYRLRVENDDGMHIVEQQGYFDASDGRITHMSLVCSGYRPWPATR